MPPRRSPSNAVRTLLFALALTVAGCSGPTVGQPVDHWTLDALGEKLRPITLPTHLDLPDRPLRYRITTEVALDDALRGQDLDLVFAYLAASASLRVNGRAVRDPHDTLSPDQYRRVGPQRWLIPASQTQARTLQLELEITHRWTQSAWLDLAPRLVPAGFVTQDLVRNRYFNQYAGWFGFIAMLQIGVSFFAVYFWTRARVYLWFGIQGTAASLFPAYMLGLGIGVVSPWLESVTMAFFLAMAAIVAVYCTNAFFGLATPHWIWPVELFLSFACTLHALYVGEKTDFLILYLAAPLVVACVVSVVIYQIITGIRLLRTDADRSEVLFVMGCWVALGSLAWPDLLAWVGGGEALGGARPACLGLGVFGVLQSLVLSRSYFRTLHQSDQLNERLRGQLHDIEAHTVEIQSLNTELRKQIGRRTAHILAALTNSETLSGAVDLAPGSVIEGRYRVVARIGEGGMGSVYEVERVGDGVHLALKVTQEVRGLALARLAREAQIATLIQHPNVVSIVDADVAQSGYIYLVMELVRGTSLKGQKARDALWAIDVLTQIASGLQALHEQHIVHRDLKPANVLLSGDLDHAPVVKITDFGISRTVTGRADPTKPSLEADDRTVPMIAPVRESELTLHETAVLGHPSTPSSAELTRAGEVVGTPAYLPPELASGAELTPAADVFAFGILAYQLLTGSRPFERPPFMARVRGEDDVQHAPLRPSCRGVPESVVQVVEACLSLQPEDRPSTSELLRELQEAKQALEAEPAPAAGEPLAAEA